jgi:hypothetical protein
MSNPILVEDRSDAHSLTQLSDAHTALRQCQAKRAALVLPLVDGRTRPAVTIAALDPNARLVTEGTAEIVADILSVDAVRRRNEAMTSARVVEAELERMSATIRAIERQIDTLRATLSPIGSTIYRALSRAKRLPFISRLEQGACSGCNMRAPSALAAAVLSKGSGLQCPFCSRLLLPLDEIRRSASS